MSAPADKLSAASVSERLKAVVKARGGIHHHARALAAEHFATPAQGQKVKDTPK
jgi:hypothetical protein